MHARRAPSPAQFDFAELTDCQDLPVVSWALPRGPWAILQMPNCIAPPLRRALPDVSQNCNIQMWFTRLTCRLLENRRQLKRFVTTSTDGSSNAAMQIAGFSGLALMWDGRMQSVLWSDEPTIVLKESQCPFIVKEWKYETAMPAVQTCLHLKMNIWS